MMCMEQMIEYIKDLWNPDLDPKDQAPITWVDMHLVEIIHELLILVREQDARIDRLENPSEYDALMTQELANRHRGNR